LLLAEVNIGEQDLPCARQLRVAQFVSDGSIVIDPHFEGRHPRGDDRGDWPNPSNAAPQMMGLSSPARVSPVGEKPKNPKTATGAIHRAFIGMSSLLMVMMSIGLNRTGRFANEGKPAE
jgi:hypothetical protein